VEVDATQARERDQLLAGDHRGHAVRALERGAHHVEAGWVAEPGQRARGLQRGRRRFRVEREQLDEPRAAGVVAEPGSRARTA
jgi:hypothetical protein